MAQNYVKYLERKNAPIPAEHSNLLSSGIELSSHKLLPIAEINTLFDDGYLDEENGFRQNDDGSVYASVLTQMPGVTIPMIDWWFWWHAAEDVRYQIWYPDMHYAIDSDFQGCYEDDSLTYRERLHRSSHLVTEDVGTGREKILIDFMSPAEFGFDVNRLDPETYTIICARVGSPDKGVWGTRMCHFVRATDEGVEMRSRFWIGYEIKRMGGVAQAFFNSLLNQSFVKKRLLPKGLAKAMFHHCSQEYHNLAEILPELYSQEAQ